MFTLALVKRTVENTDKGTFTMIQNRLIKITESLRSAMNNGIFLKVKLKFVMASTVLIALDSKSWLQVPSSSSSSSPSKKSLRISVGHTAVERDSGLSSSESLSSEEAICSMDLTGDAAAII